MTCTRGTNVERPPMVIGIGAASAPDQEPGNRELLDRPPTCWALTKVLFEPFGKED